MKRLFWWPLSALAQNMKVDEDTLALIFMYI